MIEIVAGMIVGNMVGQGSALVMLESGMLESISNTIERTATKMRKQKQKNIDFWIPENDPRK